MTATLKVGSRAAAWPSQAPAAMNTFYGDPDVNHDGVADLAWQKKNLTTIVPPYRMYYDGEPVKRITVHKKIAVSLVRILTRIGETFDAAERKALQLDQYGGVNNFRRKRGGKGLSIHSWAAAIDLAPAVNGFGVRYNEAAGMMPMAVVRIFEAEGWEWGGLWSRPDAMHFQAAYTGGKPALPPAELEPPVPQYPKALVTAIQQALLDKGYPQIGQIDGKFGGKTRKTIRAFEDEHGMPLTGIPTGALLEAILSAEVEMQPEERIDATAAQVREVAPEVKATWQSKVALFWGGIVTGLTWLGSFIVENIEWARDQVQPLLTVLGEVPIYVYLAIVGAALFFAWQRTQQAEKGQLEAFRSGERR